MRSLILFLGLGGFLCAVILASTAVAQQIDQECLCQDRYQLGQLGGQRMGNGSVCNATVCGGEVLCGGDILNVDDFFREFARDVCECGYLDPSPFNDPRMKTVMMSYGVLDTEDP